MVKLLLWATFGLCFLKLCEAQTQFNISCRYAGVFHVEKNRRYSLMREDAIVLCRALNSTLPTMEQMEKAYKLGFETCRYGFIEDKIVLPRINPYHLCAANYTGIYILSSNTTQHFDTYCYNASETRDKACEPIQKLDLRFDNSSLADENQIVIDNADGSRYTDGVKNPDPTPAGYDNTAGSGSSHDTSTMNHDDLSLDFSGAGKKEYTSTDPGDENMPMGTTASSIPMGPKDFPGKDSSDPYKQHPTSSNVVSTDESSTQDSLTPAHKPGWGPEGKHPISTSRKNVSHETTPPNGKKEGDESSHIAVTSTPEASTQEPLWHAIPPEWGNGNEYSTSTPKDVALPGVTPLRERDHKNDTSHTVFFTDAKPEDTTQDSLTPAHKPGWGPEAKPSPSTSREHVSHETAPPNGNEEGSESSHTAVTSRPEASTRESIWHNIPPERGNGNEYSTATSKDVALPGVTPPKDRDHKNDTSHTGFTTNRSGRRRPHIGAMDATSFPGQSTTIAVISQPRSAKIPEWLIIVAALVALILILAVCIAVNSRRRCGQKKKLVINNGKGAVEDKKIGGLNGEASKSQEMVHLVHKEQSNDRTEPYEFLTSDETQNQEADMKTGV